VGRLVVTLALSLSMASACAEGPVPVGDDGLVSEETLAEVSSSEEPDAPLAAGDVAQERTAPDAILLDTVGPESVADATDEEVMEDADAGPEEVDAAPLLVASCSVEMTVDEETQTLLDVSVEGFHENEFGAMIYGHMLKIWAGEGSTALEILIRTDQTTLPGEVTPGVPGSHAWLLMMINDAEVYTTQMPSGLVTVSSCPSEEGMLVSGTLSDVVAFEMGTMQPVTLSGSFEVVLGEVVGEALCSGL
jgi:hypothetical protein